MDSAYIGPGLEKVGRERMSHGVACSALGNCRLADGTLKLTLQGGFVNVVASDPASAWVWAKGCGREEILPMPFVGDVRPFAEKGFRYVNISCTDGKILQMLFTGFGEVMVESRFKRLWKGDDAMPPTFAIVNGDGTVAEIEIFDTETESFHHAQAGAIHELRRELPRISEMGNDRTHFLASHDDRGAALTTGGRR